MQKLDPRIVKVSIEVNGKIKTYSSPLNIVATGTKYANSIQNEATITLTNLDKATQDYLVTETSPYNFNRTPKTMILEAGRESYGTAVIYKGNVVTCTVTQPPDIGIVLKCLTANWYKGQVISRFFPGSATAQQIAQSVASDLNLNLDFQATDKNVANYQFAGGSLQQVANLNSLGQYNAFVDNDSLIMKNAYVPLTGKTRILDVESGMIGIPEFTEQGLKVKFLVDNQTTIGSGLQVRSNQYPAANGLYVIYKLNFQITSRETPFYYIAEAARLR